MTDIEIKRKELETAKRIRDNGYTCHNLPGCKEMECPCDPNPNRQDGCREWNGKPKKWDAFIATREAELAEIEKTTTKACEKCGGAGFYYTKGATTMEAVKRVCECQDHYHAGVTTAPKTLADRIPTLDDFALALIQGGYFDRGAIEARKRLYDLANALKFESDRRRGV